MSDDASEIWVLTDDRAGNRSQALGVADRLGRPYAIKDLAYGGLAGLPNAVLGASFAGLSGDSRQTLHAPWPSLVIAAGRRTAPVARRIKRASGGRAKTVQIMNPGAGLAEFDLICVPDHDPGVAGANVVTITGAPHGLTPEALAAARDAWMARLEHLTAPRIAVIVGGATRRRPFTAEMARELADTASRMAGAAGGSLMVTTSRRTGAAADALIDALTAPAEVHRWGGDGDNPYHGFLACADAVVVSGESISMCSEACAGEAPVYLYAPPALITPKHARFHRRLFEGGYARPLSGKLEAWSHPPLNAADGIAAAIAERLS
ncbi:MAG: mitochondrial fission ELM1 family protein [Magnetovibrio sp.]|nr:mitochondrial fission ELM1 family protein [Magnetovibrio sp.]